MRRLHAALRRLGLAAPLRRQAGAAASSSAPGTSRPCGADRRRTVRRISGRLCDPKRRIVRPVADDLRQDIGAARARLSEGRAMPDNTRYDAEFDAVAAALRRLCRDPLPELTPDSYLDELPRMDSLGVLHVIAMMEDEDPASKSMSPPWTVYARCKIFCMRYKRRGARAVATRHHADATRAAAAVCRASDSFDRPSQIAWRVGENRNGPLRWRTRVIIPAKAGNDQSNPTKRSRCSGA